MTEVIKVLSPTAILGYGFPDASFQVGLDRNPNVIAVDAGSTDPGPHYLGSGKSFTDRVAVKRDLMRLIDAALSRRIPLLIGSAGGAGARPHLDWCVAIIEDCLKDLNRSAKVAVISADQSAGELLAAHRSKRITPLGPVFDLTEGLIAESTHVVAQMGVEPIVRALDQGAEIVVTGRCYDPAVFAAVPIRRGFPEALALHMGKILECAAIAAVPGSGADCMLGTLTHDSFVLEPLNPERRCTVTSVAAHTLYEKSDPRYLPGPGGTLDLTQCEFEAVDARRVRVSGTQFIVDTPYRVKLEGARPIGFRTISIAGVRSPDFIGSLDAILESARESVFSHFPDVAPEEATLIFRCYGRDGVMGSLEPMRDVVPHEIGLVIEVTARSQELADTLCASARSTLLHLGYPGRQSTAGNLAFPYSPSDVSLGAVYAFSIYHLMEVDDPVTPFPIQLRVMGASA